jgi:competence protein ComFC
LERVRDTHSQIGLSKEERRENMKEAFVLKEKFKKSLENKYVLIFDDVLTTGSTIYEAVKVLKSSGVNKVWGVAFAREQ